MSRASRRNITITDLEVDKYLDEQQNASAFIQEAVKFYRKHKEKEYAAKEELEELKAEFFLLNKSYRQTKDIVEKLVEGLVKKIER